jgi:phosphatidylserine/phosphatidylglycerophosphate/cardiolipin synthase-like enzyme
MKAWALRTRAHSTLSLAGTIYHLHSFPHCIRSVRLLGYWSRHLQARLFEFIVTCCVAIDLLIHHGVNKTVKIIMNPSGQTTNRLEEFFLDHGRISLRAFRDRLQVRVANVNGANCGRYNSLHDKSVMTDLHTTFGSYNLTNGARYQNWESLHVADSEPSHAAHFDALWNSLAGRDVQVVYPALAPASPHTRSPGPPGNEGRATRRQRIR